MQALGVHVFAGGFTYGVQQVMEVVAQLESHGLGTETVERRWNVPVECYSPRDWPSVSADVVYGNPRCTGFSCVTAGYGEETHGANAKQCQDILDMVDYALGTYPLVMFESVQQAYTATGKPLMEALAHRFVQTGEYRVTHVLCSANTFGCPQYRRRYFFVAHPRDKPFNVVMPGISPYYPVIYDAMWSERDRATSEYPSRSTEYGRDSYMRLSDDEKLCLKITSTGWSLNQVLQYAYDECKSKHYRDIWDFRTSAMPFSMHCIYRPAWLRPCPTLKATSGRLLHPWHHRPFTVGELALCMGWVDDDGSPVIPVGPNPVGQLGKGIVPAVGTWIADMAARCLRDEWGGEDWELRYDHHVGEFTGHDASEQDTKLIDVTNYRGWAFDYESYPEEARKQCHRHNIDPETGKLIRPWKTRSLLP